MGIKLDFEFFEVGQIYKRFPAKKFYKGISSINFDFSRSDRFTKEFPFKSFIRGFLLEIRQNEFIRDFLYKIYKGFPLYSRSENLQKDFRYKICIKGFL